MLSECSGIPLHKEHGQLFYFLYEKLCGYLGRNKHIGLKRIGKRRIIISLVISSNPGGAWDGAETVAEVMGMMGWRISEAQAMSTWLQTSRFAKPERGNTK